MLDIQHTHTHIVLVTHVFQLRTVSCDTAITTCTCTIYLHTVSCDTTIITQSIYSVM